MRLFITTFLLSVLLAGCSTTEVMQGHHVSNVDPDVRIAKTAKIKIQGSEKGDELTNKRYIPNVIASFNALGYKNVSTEVKNPDYILTINFRSTEKKKTFPCLFLMTLMMVPTPPATSQKTAKAKSIV